MNPYLVQAIGFVGVALFILSYQIKSNRALSEGIAIASILVSIWRFSWNSLAEETS